jgi:hypothetical protein
MPDWLADVVFDAVLLDEVPDWPAVVADGIVDWPAVVPVDGMVLAPPVVVPVPGVGVISVVPGVCVVVPGDCCANAAPPAISAAESTSVRIGVMDYPPTSLCDASASW